MSLSDECKVCASSYIVVDELVRYISRLPPAGVYHGPISVFAKRGRRFVSGSSILMSRDIAADLAQNADRILSMNDGAYVG